MNKRKIGVISVLVMLALLLAGCGKNTEDPPSGETDTSETVSSAKDSSTEEVKEDGKTIQGVWNTAWDVSALFNFTIQMSLGDAALSDFVQIKDLDFPMQFTFQEDGTYTVIADQEAFQAALNGKMAELRDGFTGYFTYTIEKENLDATVEELLAASDFESMDEYLTALVGGFDGISESFEASGSWRIEGGKLHMTKTIDGDELHQSYTYALTADELRLLELHIEEDENDMEELLGDLLSDLFPMVLTRAE